jgi:hypothetical protein
MTSTGRRGFVGVERAWLANPDLSDSGLRLMLWLDSHTHEYLRDLGVKRVAAEIGWSRNRVKRTLDELVDLGLVSVQQVPHTDGINTRTLVTLHHEVWSEGGPRRTPGGVHGDALGGVHGGAPTTSNPNGEESTRGESFVVDETTLTEAERLCITMADAIAAWSNDKRPTVTKAWVTDMDRLMRLDGRDPQQIVRVIQWLYSSPDSVATFWAPNIQSPKKLRAQWIKMAMQYERLKTTTHKSDIQNDLDRIRARDAS